MKRYDNEYKLYFTNTGGIRLKRYLDELKGLPCQTIWTDINPVNSQAKEKIGYPTQKPEALLRRIIECASNEGDIVLDPFVGGGTTVAVADKFNRGWIGIDQSVQAVKVTEFRLNNQQDLFSKPFIVQLHKYDYATLQRRFCLRDIYGAAVWRHYKHQTTWRFRPRWPNKSRYTNTS